MRKIKCVFGGGLSIGQKVAFVDDNGRFSNFAKNIFSLPVEMSEGTNYYIKIEKARRLDMHRKVYYEIIGQKNSDP